MYVEPKCAVIIGEAYRCDLSGIDVLIFDTYSEAHQYVFQLGEMGYVDRDAEVKFIECQIPSEYMEAAKAEMADQEVVMG